jgi:hypothetical protein
MLKENFEVPAHPEVTQSQIKPFAFSLLLTQESWCSRRQAILGFSLIFPP